MSPFDRRPAVWIGHVALPTDRMLESAQFMHRIGMRSIFEGPQVSIFEMRGGTHLILQAKSGIEAGDAPFDLMVDDIHDTHRRFTTMGLSPSPIEAVPAIDHERFRVREPAGHWITVYSTHVGSEPV
ncbi:VOC family protein [Tahibacter amnicola]|uniref:VOC domain-containing protein n=1 Tax=Tahibacter amnicola TaxID=2976241 RepID=A0ABY6BK04_9GAMM|nr:VOC family protein [Tahibacter amnicola]UXI70104.1 hypothetical protein N4264_10885 [Tahibacter amnicola]